MSYTSENIQQRHEEVIAVIKANNGLIPDDHRPNGKIQLTHVGIFQQHKIAKNPLLVALLDGVMFCINRIDYTRDDGTLPAEESVDEYISLTKISVGGVVNHISLSMEERCRIYSEDENSLGKFLSIIPVMNAEEKAA